MEVKTLIKQVIRKNRKAQKELYQRYKYQWYGICVRYQKNDFDAADVLQNALVKIFTKIHSFDENKGDFQHWSNKIVVNENLMFLRKRKREMSIEPIETNYSIYDESETPIEKLSAMELTKLIRGLPDGYRTIFNLYVMDGLNHNEISELMNITVGTSKSQLYKARKLLQQKIEVMI